MEVLIWQRLCAIEEGYYSTKTIEIAPKKTLKISFHLNPSQEEQLVDYAVRAWRLKYPTSKVDDCAVVCLFLNNSLTSETKSKSALAQGPSAQAVPKEITSMSATDLHKDSKKKIEEFLIDSKTNTPTLVRANHSFKNQNWDRN